MNNVPASEEISYEVEPRTDKLLDSKGELNGGGDPDRTGDPRLMSPLLCQLSYTATPMGLLRRAQSYPRRALTVYVRALAFNAQGFDLSVRTAAPASVVVLESAFAGAAW